MDKITLAEARRCNKNIPDSVQPTAHVHYRERVLDIADDLPKFSDVPEAFGGTGKRVERDGTPIEE